ncbi:MAG: DUF2752 domain-containing protein [Muribaculaceae bacterium]|nr:DUF2752 domain-containing protein [Muribaculaceae bacterium]
MARRRVWLWLGVGVALCFLALYTLVDPSTSAWLPRCPLLTLTGLECPGCGSQRAVHALLNGDLPGAWGFNPLLVVMLPVVGLMAYAELRRERHPRLYRAMAHPALIFTVLAMVVGWGVMRNLI